MSHDEHDEHEAHDEPLDIPEGENFHGITLSPEALLAARALLAEHPEWQGLPLRVYIDGKGCDGFYYGVTFDAATEAACAASSEDSSDAMS